MVHIPVLLKEMLLYLSPHNGGIYVDATFGSGGYSKAILESADCNVYAIDRDETVVRFYDHLSSRYLNRLELFIGKFSDIKRILSSRIQISEIKILKKSCDRTLIDRFTGCVDGVVFDVGVSSMQIEEGNRGFSFLHNGPLDMRMDGSSKVKASTFVNALSEKEIASIIYHYGGERYSRKIARAIVNMRKKRPIKTTFELADIVRSVVFRGKSKIDPATRTFQAIRIWVNDELQELKNGIEAASEILSKNGRLVVVTFHSLEDRIVKTFFRKKCDERFNNCRIFSILNKRVIKPSFEEIRSNPRARSAKLRAIQRLS